MKTTPKVSYRNGLQTLLGTGLFLAFVVIMFHGVLHMGSGQSEFMDVYKEYRYNKDCHKVLLGNEAIKYYCTDGSTMYIRGSYVEWTSSDIFDFNGGWTERAPKDIAW